MTWWRRTPTEGCKGCGEAPCGCYVRTLCVDGKTIWVDVDHPRYHEARPRLFS